jgi:hypothetical protein
MGTCFACRIAAPLERAHILPRWAGGSDEPVNLHLLCRACHLKSEGLFGISYWRWFAKSGARYRRSRQAHDGVFGLAA